MTSGLHDNTSNFDIPARSSTLNIKHMEELQFKEVISAPVNKVFDFMLGTETFKIWTSVFDATSDFEGNWEQGAKVMFTCINKEGKKQGMIGIIETYIPNEFVSVKYTGFLDGDKEITEGPEVASVRDTHENYTFSFDGRVTTVTVDLDVDEPYLGYFQETYPKALLKLKEIVEAS